MATSVAPIRSRYPRITVNTPNAENFPRTYFELALFLKDQPIFTGSGPSDEPCKAIALSNWSDAKILDIFTLNLRKNLGLMNAWHIHSFINHRFLLSEPLESRISQGVSLVLSNEGTMCSKEVLQKSYDQIFSKMINGWTETNLKDHPDIMFQENPEEFDLFIKEDPLDDESALVRFIADKVSMSENVKCHSEWSTHPGFRFGKVYLWIRRTKRQDITERIGFNLNSLQR